MYCTYLFLSYDLDHPKNAINEKETPESIQKINSDKEIIILRQQKIFIEELLIIVYYLERRTTSVFVFFIV